MGEAGRDLSRVLLTLMDSTVAVADRWAGLDADTVTVAEAGALLEGLDRQINRLEGARSKLAASFSRRDGHRATGHKNLGHWMQDRLRRSPTQAHKEAKTAEQLAELSATADALGNGDISLEHAAVIAEQATKSEDPQQAQRTLLAEARATDPGRVRKAGRRMRRDEARRTEDARKVRMAKKNRTLTFRADDTEKTMWIEGRLPMIDGVKARAALDALAAPVGPDDDRTYGQRMADALTELVDRAEDGRGLPTQRGIPVEIMAVVPVDAIERRAGVPSGTISGVPGGGIDLSDAELAELLQRARLSWLIVDPAGVPLRYGRGRRFASTDQRRVLRARDGGCAWPRCDAPGVWTVAHHEPPFDQRGGATDLSTQALLCDTHHGLRHDGRWIVQLAPDATITVTSPDGQTVVTETAAQRRARHGTWELSTHPNPHDPHGTAKTPTNVAQESHGTYDTGCHERRPTRIRGSPGRRDPDRTRLTPGEVDRARPSPGVPEGPGGYPTTDLSGRVRRPRPRRPRRTATSAPRTTRAGASPGTHPRA